MRSFITASIIADRLCSPRRDGQELLPQLVSKLIKNSIAENVIRNFRFPYGDQVYLHGPDGVLYVDEKIQSNYIPDGISLWEMTTDNDSRSKANDDFSKAEKKLADAFADFPSPITPDKATFVFVTSKPWESGEWISEKRKTSKWKSIKVVDAVVLEQWIEQCPRVMLWFAEQCGLPAEGLYDAEQYLKKLGISFGVSSLSPELVLAGRDETAQKLKEQIFQQNTDFIISGESTDEAAAFLAAASIKEADTYSQKAPLIFADSAANLNVLATISSNLILVPLDVNTLNCVKMIPEWKIRIIIPDTEAIVPTNNTIFCLVLDKCKRDAIEKQLIEQIKLPEHKAKMLSRDTKGSLIALLWLIGSGPIGIPRWAGRKDATTHASLILAGSWIGSNENDTKIIERLSKKDYRDIETLLQSAELPDGPWIHRDTEWRCVSRDFVWKLLIGKVTETMLKDFQEITQEVLSEQDPILELPRSKQHMAGILGKKRKYSRSLRLGLVDSVARLAIFRSDGQSWANHVVQNLLDTNSPNSLDRWLSLSDVYSELAEAAPDVFLDCLEGELRSAEAGQLFQSEDCEYDIFAPTSAHVHLLWALERLAWQTEYLSRVLHILTKMAEIKPNAKSGNNPQKSIITILLPWSPQHADSMENAALIFKSLYVTSPTVTWNVGLKLLPSSHGVQFPTPIPHYRKHQGSRKITQKEYWEFCQSLVEMMIMWAGIDANRWSLLLKQYPDVWREWPELGQSIVDALVKVDPNQLTDDKKVIIYQSLRQIISSHRQYSEAYWALPGSVLENLEALETRFLPQDAVLQYSQLFSWNPDVPDAPKKKYGHDWKAWIFEKQTKAMKVVYDQGGLADVRRLSDLVELPDRIGRSLAQMRLPEDDVAGLLRLGLDPSPSEITQNRFAQCVRAYVLFMFQKEGEAWLDRILAFQDVNWTTNAYANLTLALPASPVLWDRVQQWGNDVDKLYWSNVGIRGDCSKHWPQVLEKWREVKRLWSSLELVAELVDEGHDNDDMQKPSVDIVAEIMGSVSQPDKNTEPLRNYGNMLSHYVEHMFLFLDDENVDQQQIAQLEWLWLRVLEHTQRGAKALHSQITSSPKLFVDLLKAVFRGENEPQETDKSDERSKLAEHAYHLLKDIHTVPGYRRISDKEEHVNQLELQQWVEEARRLSLEVGRLGVCNSQIGQILSFAPSSPDGSWPCVEVRDVIENIQSPELESGFYIGKCNQRGVVCRGKGGDQERELVEKYTKLADLIRTNWPRTASILNSLAKSYENEAVRWDKQAKRNEYEF